MIIYLQKIFYFPYFKDYVYGYTQYRRKNFQGHGIKQFSNQNRHSCGQKCNSDDNCVAFVYHLKNKLCFTKRVGEIRGNKYFNDKFTEFFIKASSSMCDIIIVVIHYNPLNNFRTSFILCKILKYLFP